MWKKACSLVGIALLLGCQTASEGEKQMQKEFALSEDPNYYTEQYRPQFHFSTPVGNLADPNGLVYYEGEYHLFHQKNGTWAHAVSPDLLHWEHLPIALEHDELGQALSGSVVVDEDDTSGLFNGEAGLVAIYTNTEGGEAQSIAYSSDNGRSWQRYEHNPVIENPGIKDFRDPKVFWHDESSQWVMVVSTDKSVTFYQSDNLIDWTYASRFGDGQGSHVAVWECPDLFRLPVDGDADNKKWVLHVSVGDNDETNGSTAQYFIGEFDGTTFVNENDPDDVLITDYGQDFYAAQSFSNVTDRVVWLGWMANWRYPYQSPTEPWMGSLSIPRELALRTNQGGTVQLVQTPIPELEQLSKQTDTFESFKVDSDVHTLPFTGTNYILNATVSWDQLTEFGLRLRHGDGVESLVGFDAAYNKVFLDRTNAGLASIIDRNGENFPFGQRYESEYDAGRGEMMLTAVVDESSIELFINDGELVFTSLIYTDPTNDGIEWYAEGGEIHVKDLEITHLANTWRVQTEPGTFERLVTNVEQARLPVGETMELRAQHKPDYEDASGESLSWDSDNTDIVQLKKEAGNVIEIEAISEGAATITVTNEAQGLTKDIRIYTTK
ncbi:fructan beta-fructosidase [Alkalihalobacillus xiaoxiensis]|uniref:Fructan beta-fructosidase n=1 Tax=Shouchella xiaoxiensis TaxID=766895 RepID=A0ABS2SNW2_9BACI|nr:glycoside hydrolase family 32 protein [Shouchella xiaoxiensis]MBM7837202.1 fructan beta-fructosidase [Shouchella xiaoxiensis]